MVASSGAQPQLSVMNALSPHDADGQSDREFFRNMYSLEHSVVAREVERNVLGHEVGLNGYTTVEQAQQICDALALSVGDRLLDLGAGRGWPGRLIAESSGCSLMSTDTPLQALKDAKEYVAGLDAHVVAADGRALPFEAELFDAVSHADVFC